MESCFAPSLERESKISRPSKAIPVKQKKETAKPFIIPKSFVSILSEKKCQEYLEKNNCLQAKEKAKASFMYDVKQHRIVFLIKEKEKVIGAIGRGLNSQIYPKWYIYGEKSYPFICGEGKVGVLVEDCASACAVSGVYAGIALMGTSLPDSYIPILQKELNPFRRILKDNDFFSGKKPMYCDYLLFGFFMWARNTSPKQLLDKNDILWLWRERMLNLFDGFAKKSNGYEIK